GPRRGPALLLSSAPDQALGLRPWLAAFFLRSRRLRARLLIGASWVDGTERSAPGRGAARRRWGPSSHGSGARPGSRVVGITTGVKTCSRSARPDGTGENAGPACAKVGVRSPRPSSPP